LQLGRGVFERPARFSGRISSSDLLCHCSMAKTELSDFYATTREARKIIVVDLGFLGDSIHLIPALVELKRHYPRAELHVLSAPLGQEVLSLVPSVDRAWAFPLGPQSPPWWRHWDVIRALRREHFDLAFNFSGADRTLFLTALTGAKWRIAHLGCRQHFWNGLLIPNWVPRRPSDLPVYQQRRSVLAACGLSLGPAQFELRPNKADLVWASRTVPRAAIHVSLNSANPLKEWPVGHYVELLRILWQAKPELRFVATASPARREQERLAAFEQTVGDSRLIALQDRLTVSQLAAVLGRCALHIGPDSGVIHLAMALEVPTVSLFRQRGQFSGWIPPGDQHHAVLAPCTCLEDRGSACERAGRAACLAAVTPDRLAAVAMKQLQSGHPKSLSEEQ
jgi:ADP-heptose:LPS heptosyltransferase